MWRSLVITSTLLAACGSSSSAGDDAPTCGVLTTDAVVLLDTNDVIPAGWACLSCAAGDPFLGRFPVGALTAGGTGGTTTHAHAFTTMQMGNPSTTGIDATQGTASIATGPHPMASGMTTPAEHLPRFRTMKMIAPQTSTNVVPAGAIVILDVATIPAGFTRYFAQDNAFISGGPIAEIGGAGDHQHSFTATIAAGNAALRLAGTTRTVAASNHTHMVSGSSGTFTNDPRHAIVVLARAEADTELPAGAIAMFEATPSSVWTVRDDLVGAFLKADAVPNLTLAGNSMHGGEVTVTSTAASASTQVTTGNTNVATGAHTHQIRVALAPVDHRPPYREVIYAQLTGDACPID